MPLNYSIAMLPNPREKNDPHKAYAKAQINGEMSLKELSKEVASKSTVHSADVYAVLIATTESMLSALKAGKQVDFGELGKFRLQINSKGAITAEDFTSDNITGVAIQYVPGEDLNTRCASSATWRSRRWVSPWSSAAKVRMRRVSA